MLYILNPGVGHAAQVSISGQALVFAGSLVMPSARMGLMLLNPNP